MSARLLQLVLALLALSVALAPDARAHAILVSSQPAANAEVAGPDVEIRLEFNSRIDAARSLLQLAHDGGEPVVLPLEKSEEANKLGANATGLAPGAYRMRWQVLSVDGGK